MAIVVIAPSKSNLDYWQEALQAEAARQGMEVPVWIGPEVEQPDKVKMAVVWKHRPESLHQYSNLQLISSMGAGVDHILKDKDMPVQLRVCRIVDPQLTQSMSNYLLAVVLGYHKRLPEWQELQKKKMWGYSDEPERPLRIGVLGMGALGSDIAMKLAGLGFPVWGYSNSPKKIEGVVSMAGEDELDKFLQQVNVLICLLPLTAQTSSFLDKELFKRCSKGTYLINVARGQHLVEEDLLWALERGYLSGAMLDVFRQEPLPEDHPFWQHEAIGISPHIASVTHPEAAIPQIIENYLRLEQGRELKNEIDPGRGY